MVELLVTMVDRMRVRVSVSEEEAGRILTSKDPFTGRAFHGVDEYGEPVAANGNYILRLQVVERRP